MSVVQNRSRVALLALVSAAWLNQPTSARPTPIGTTFTYQGQLKQGGDNADGAYDMRFSLWDAMAGPAPVGSIVCKDNVAVTDGLFTVTLDFGAQFAEQQRFLEIEVRTDSGLDCTNATGFVILAPRQSLTTAPYSQYALNAASAASATNASTATNATQLNGQAASFYTNAGNLTGTLSGAALLGAYGNALNLSNASNSYAGSGAGLTGLNASNFTTGTLSEARLPMPLNLSGANDNHIFHVQNTSSTHGSMAIVGQCTGTGINYGVYGQSLNSHGVYGSTVHGTGVRGEATADDSYPGVTYGVYGVALNQAGTGVLGFGATGVWGETTSTSGVAVRGRATAATGTNYGVLGTSLSPDGYGGYFNGRGYFSGHVGIGTGFPSHPLTVQSTAIKTMRLIGPTGQYQYGARFNFGDDDYAYIEEDTDDNLSFRANRFNFVNGNVGIGLTGPTFQLQLSANSAAKPTSSSWTISSDERLKKSIHTIDGALDQLMQLRGVTYQWKDPASQGDMDGTYTGMIAQDVEKVFPEWIRDDANGYKTLTVIGFEGIVVEALRELRNEKDAQLASVRAENADLRARIDSLEHMMRQLLASQTGGPR